MKMEKAKKRRRRTDIRYIFIADNRASTIFSIDQESNMTTRQQCLNLN